jgi:hypothetical protein
VGNTAQKHLAFCAGPCFEKQVLAKEQEIILLDSQVSK